MSVVPAPPVFWQQAWDAAQPRLTTITTALEPLHRSPEARSPRVAQLDTEQLDQELLDLLREPINKSLGILNTRWRTRFERELTLLIRVVLYKYSIWDSAASYGARLQNLHYTLTSTRSSPFTPSRLSQSVLVAHATLTVILPYVHARLRSYALSAFWPDAPSVSRQRRAWEALSRLESVHAFLALFNFLAFLYNGQYRTLVDRLLGMRLTPVARIANRSVSYEYMNRQMVWHAFTEFLLFFLPILNTRKLRRSARRAAAKLRASLLSLPGPLHAEADDRASISKYAWLPEDACAICAEDVSTALRSAVPASSTYALNTPYVTSCGHMYCYACVADRMLRMGDEGEEYWECLRCNGRVRYIHRLEERIEDGTGTSENSECDLDTMSLNSEDTFGTFSSDGALSE